MSDLRSDSAKARDTWLESDEGKKCCENIAGGQYLKNRLELAFLAGRDSRDTDPPVKCPGQKLVHCLKAGTECGYCVRNPYHAPIDRYLPPDDDVADSDL